MAVSSLNAGVDHLLIADLDGQVERVAKAIRISVEKGELQERRLDQAAERVRALAGRYARVA